MQTFVKRSLTAPPGFFACEVAGLRWLSEAHGALCVEVLEHDRTSLTLRRLESVAPTREAAAAFGASLATTHDAGADGWGAPPSGWSGPGYFGPLSHPLPMTYGVHDTWGRFYAEERLAPIFERARPSLTDRAARDVSDVMEHCIAGEFDDDDTPSRLHGDLWSGNLIWTGDGVVLIDPAACGGHRETDLAMLHLFGCPYLEDLIDGYQRAHPLRPGWRGRIALHQLYPLLAHVVLFGVGYAQQTHAAARRALGSADLG
ncbi:fructosamine kinase family protein [Mycobacterium sp. ACS4331]|uniref:fructosamine kinase family protein n=1 Tax=Mycobacterium sp. ACS4331 TaxID=1834121 RepID=UPI0008008C98|nr:fructosamine kinase family protein [Mycobacterium sp. ACS4331]OBF26748.1 fructosamine kinase [Mycobacterium sp. ACS4331]